MTTTMRPANPPTDLAARAAGAEISRRLFRRWATAIPVVSLRDGVVHCDYSAMTAESTALQEALIYLARKY